MICIDDQRNNITILIGMVLLSVCVSYGQLSTARITATQGRLDTVCGTHNVKVVFICKGYGYFVDFSETTPRIRQMANVTNSYFPVISSDGRWLAYQTGIEVEGPSKNPLSGKAWFRELAVDGAPVKIADTGYVPRFVQNAPDDTPAIVYSTSVACPQEICYTAGMTLKRRIVDKTPLPADTVFPGGSYYGGLSWDNRYLITGWPGGPNGFMLDLRNSDAGPSAVHTMRVKKTGTDVDTFVRLGTCNISRSASRIFTNTMLYYDFGSAAITAVKCYHPLLGTWGMHAKLFISRYDSEDVKVFDMPADRKLIPIADATGTGGAVGKEWYYPEWSNHPYFGVAGLDIDRLWLRNGDWEDTYTTESIYLIGLKDSQYVKLIESTDTAYTSTTSFKYPFLWVEVSAGFEEDSAWLAKTIWQRSGVVNPFEHRKQTPGINSLRGIPASAEVSLYTLSGNKLATIPSNGLAAGWVRGMAPSGGYLVKIHEKGKGQRCFKVITIH